MIPPADGVAGHTTSRRRTANGWHTSFVGKHRNTLTETAVAPAVGCLYPVAFRVAKEGAAVVHPYFYQVDQYQIVVQGSGRLGIHDIASITIHYTDAYSAYGPIVAAGEGVAWRALGAFSA
jgi:hypothetical protein